MAPNSLSPASVVIDYHSAYGAHKMTIPTREWFPTDITGALGSFTPWTGSPVDGETMVRDLLALLKVFMLPTSGFDAVTAYTQATPTSPNIPQKRVVLSIVGTSISTGLAKAISTTFNGKTTGNGVVKLVLLDTPLGGGGFEPILGADFDTNINNLIAEFSNTGKAWSGRDDNRPNVFNKVSFDLNDKLQKLYKMV